MVAAMHRDACSAERGDENSAGWDVEGEIERANDYLGFAALRQILVTRLCQTGPALKLLRDAPKVSSEDKL